MQAHSEQARAEEAQAEEARSEQAQSEQAQPGRVLFQPELFVGASYTDNALLVGREENETPIYRMGAVLPITRTYPRGRFTLSYSSIYERFEDFEELDHVNHRAQFAWTTRPSDRSSFGLRGRYARFQDNRTVELRQPIVFLREPVTREVAAVDLSFGRQITQRWRWRGGAGFSDWSFEPIEDGDAMVVAEDRQEARASLGLTRRVKKGLRFGGEYAVRRFDLEVSGEETAHLVSFTIERTIEDQFKMAFGIGGFRTEGDSDDSDTGAQGWLTLSRTFDENTLSFTATHRPNVGGSRLGTAELSTAVLGIDGAGGGAWLWGLYGRYARRVPRLPQESEIESVGADGYLERRFQKVVGLRLGAGYAEQSADEPAQEGEVYRVNLTLLVYPMARSRLGGHDPDSE